MRRPAEDAMGRAVQTLQARIGEDLEPRVRCTVDASMVRAFTRAVGWPAAAPASDEIPVSFLSHIGLEPASVVEDRRPEETLGGTLFDPLNGGTVVRSQRTARVGETFTRVVRLKAAEVRQTRSGPVAAVVVEIEITGADGVVGTAERTMLYRGARA